jgi:hypothetical protein
MLGKGKVPQRAVAEQLQITPQVVSKQLAAADFTPLIAAISFVEGLDWSGELVRGGVRFVRI